MRRLVQWLYCIAFFALCAAFPLLLGHGEGNNMSNRALAGWPALMDDARLNLEFPTQFDEWFADHLPGRNQLVTAFHRINQQLLGDVNSEQVISGRYGYLFFASTLADYQRSNPLTDTQLAQIVQGFVRQRDLLAQQGVPFLVAFAPNKSSIYPEYMPVRLGRPDSASNLERLQQALGDAGVEYVDWQAVLLENKGGVPLYYKEDSHWNELGAAYAYEALMQKAETLCPSLVYTQYSQQPYEQINDRQGDLANMVYPAQAGEDTRIEFNIQRSYRYARPPGSMEDIRIETSLEDGRLRLLMIRDSFANNLIPYLSEQFSYVSYERAVPFPQERIGQTQPDLMVWEVVERNIPDLLQALPQ